MLNVRTGLLFAIQRKKGLPVASNRMDSKESKRVYKMGTSFSEGRGEKTLGDISSESGKRFALTWANKPESSFDSLHRLHTCREEQCKSEKGNDHKNGPTRPKAFIIRRWNGVPNTLWPRIKRFSCESQTVWSWSDHGSLKYLWALARSLSDATATCFAHDIIIAHSGLVVRPKCGK